MKFSEIVEQASALLQRAGRSTYRALKLEFDLNDDQLEALKDELLFAHPEIVDEAGRGLVWTGATLVSSFKFQVRHSLLLHRRRTSNFPPSATHLHT